MDLISELVFFFGGGLEGDVSKSHKSLVLDVSKTTYESLEVLIIKSTRKHVLVKDYI